MSCSAEPREVLECNFCGTQFVKGVADSARDGQPRCPQCLICDAHPVTGDEIGDFVVDDRIPFR